MRIAYLLAAAAVLGLAACGQTTETATEDAAATTEQAADAVGEAADATGDAVEGAVNDAANAVADATDDNPATGPAPATTP